MANIYASGMIQIPDQTTQQQSKNQNNVISAGLVTFMKELDKIQESQLQFTIKIQKEKKRSEELDEGIQKARKELKELQENTRNGDINRVDDVTSKKLINKLEHQLQITNNKLSTLKNDNIILKYNIDELRRENVICLKALRSSEIESNECKNRIIELQKENIIINEKKHRSKINLLQLNNKLLTEMEEFSNEIDIAKDSLLLSHNNVINTLDNKMKSSLNIIIDKHLYNNNNNKLNKFEIIHYSNNIINEYDKDIKNILNELQLLSLNELFFKVQESEEDIFLLYNKILDKHDEYEKLEIEQKNLSITLQTQNDELTNLKLQCDKILETIEENINNTKKNIEKYQQEYNHSLSVVKSLSDRMMKVLRYVANEDDPMDLQLLSTGINDRNIEDYLGLMEQRIDDIIQISKAALHEPLNNIDFISTITENPYPIQPSYLTTLLDTIENEEDNIDETIKLAPIQISQLKDEMSKKVQAVMAKASARLSLYNNNQSRTSFRSSMSRSSLGSRVSLSSRKFRPKK